MIGKRGEEIENYKVAETAGERLRGLAPGRQTSRGFLDACEGLGLWVRLP